MKAIRVGNRGRINAGLAAETLRQAVFRRDGFRCVFCGSRTSLSLDHIMPRSVGGTDDPTNLQTLCRSCNSSKRDRLHERVGCVGCGHIITVRCDPRHAEDIAEYVGCTCGHCGGRFVYIGRVIRPLEPSVDGLAAVMARHRAMIWDGQNPARADLAGGPMKATIARTRDEQSALDVDAAAARLVTLLAEIDAGRADADALLARLETGAELIAEVCARFAGGAADLTDDESRALCARQDRYERAYRRLRADLGALHAAQWARAHEAATLWANASPTVAARLTAAHGSLAPQPLWQRAMDSARYDRLRDRYLWLEPLRGFSRGRKETSCR